MPPPRETGPRAQAELLVLRAICQESPPGPVREAASRLLKSYRWQEPVHQVIFTCLLQLPAGNPELLRTELPACLTRKGFPDVDWEVFFEPLSHPLQDVEKVMLRLTSIHGPTEARPSGK
jgi:hypothetical protein